MVVVGLLAWPTIKRISENNIKFGKKFNHVRDSLGIPIVEENWTISESNPDNRFWKIADNFEPTHLPIHESKMCYFQDAGSLFGEEDDFFYDMSDSLAYRLILRYEFKKSVWDNEFVRIRKFGKKPAEYWPLTISQTDSVLAKWGLSR